MLRSDKSELNDINAYAVKNALTLKKLVEKIRHQPQI